MAHDFCSMDLVRKTWDDTVLEDQIGYHERVLGGRESGSRHNVSQSAERLTELLEERDRRHFISLPKDIVSIYDILQQYRDKDGVK